MKTDTSSIESIATSYHLNENISDKWIEDLSQKYFFQVLRQLLTKNARVVEMGFGDGLSSSLLSSLPIDLTIVEGSISLVDRARSEPCLKAATVVHSMFEDFLPDHKFDFVIAAHVLEHVNDPASLLKHIKNWLLPSGKVVIVVPNAESIHRRLAVLMGLQPALDSLSGRDRLVGHQRVYSLSSLKNDVHDAGFSVLKEFGYFFKPFSNSMLMPFESDLILAMNQISSEIPPEFLANISLIIKPN